MTKIILGHDRRIQVPDPSLPFAVCDEAGNVLGRYIPTSMEPSIGREEVERRKQQKGTGYTTDEVLAHLEKL